MKVVVPPLNICIWSNYLIWKR